MKTGALHKRKRHSERGDAEYLRATEKRYWCKDRARAQQIDDTDLLRPVAFTVQHRVQRRNSDTGDHRRCDSHRQRRGPAKPHRGGCD
jgi:hypothetical protein